MNGQQTGDASWIENVQGDAAGPVSRIAHPADTVTPPGKDFVKFYPNPCSGSLYLVLPEEFAVIKVYDRTGRCMFTERTRYRLTRLDLTGLPVGDYFLDVKSPGRRVRSSFVVQ